MSNGRVRSDFKPASLFVGRPHDASGKRISTAAPSARERFATQRPILLASRPLITPERVERPGTGGRAFKKGRVIAAVYGKPTFKNAIIDGRLV